LEKKLFDLKSPDAEHIQFGSCKTYFSAVYNLRSSYHEKGCDAA